jgi:hypothetical protein
VIRTPSALPLGLAYREWLLGLARAEADAGCPRLFAMKSEITMYFGDLVANWSAERRYQLMSARTKKLCTGNYGYPAVPVTEEEKLAGAMWDYPFLGRDLGLGPFRSPTKASVEITWTSGERGLVDADKLGAVLRWEKAQLGGIGWTRRRCAAPSTVQ